MFSTFQLLGVFLPSSSTNKRHKETTRSKTLAITYLMLCAMPCAAGTPPRTPWVLWAWPPRSRCGIHPLCSLVHWQMDPGTSVLMTEPRMVRMACSSSVFKNSFSVSRFHQGKTSVVGWFELFISPLGRAVLNGRDSLWLVQLKIGGRHVRWAFAFQNFIWAKTGRKLRWALVILSS